MPPIPIVLILNTGTQDIKRWLPEPIPKQDDNRKRDLFGGRDAHRWLAAGISEAYGGGADYRFLCSDERNALREQDGITIIGHACGVALADGCGDLPAGADRLPELLSALDRTASCAAELDADGKLLLKPAKIDLLLPTLREHNGGALRIRRVLAFGTDRISPEEFELRLRADPNFSNATNEEIKARVDDHRFLYRQEPCMAHEVMARYLAGVFGLTPDQGKHLGAARFAGRDGARWVNLLDGLASYEGRAGTADHPLDRRLVRILDQAVKDAEAGIDNAHALIAVTGGSNNTKDCIVASARLHFRNRCHEHDETERGGEFQVKQLGRQRPFLPAVEAITLRGQCRALIAQGEILSAAALVEPLIADEQPEGQAAGPEPPPLIDKDQTVWVQPILRAGRFYRGEALSSKNMATLLGSQEDQLPPRLKQSSSYPLLLQRAFQVESALQGGPGHQRLPEALAGTTAVVERALYLVLCEAIPRYFPGCIARIDENTGQVYSSAGEAMTTVPACEPPLPKALEKVLKDGVLEVIGWRAEGARKWLANRSVDNNGEDWAARGVALRRVEKLLQCSPEVPNNDHRRRLEFPHLRDLRNQLAHAALEEPQLRRLLDLATRPLNCGGEAYPTLWNLAPATQRGDHFLGGALITALFASLGIPNVPVLYRDMLANLDAGLTSRVATPPVSD